MIEQFTKLHLSGIQLRELLLIIGMILLLFSPTFIALKKNHPHKKAIIIVNFIGFFVSSFISIGAFIWCFIHPSKKKSSDQLQ
ncbi:superinfection immunity protein [Photobacterium galatheae]|uniref:Superinfection immunity protein n=1 Tax=Photobacterium galatheae TaxID=1654360 RepID=A0A066RIL0_9GAMM|nr:superinfection immunity protein [Photobacterium galatheae]KDM90270.1 hypothetical protein EA58_18330 [Photobacterium galatheae]MCM0151468.1 superinfection immunity protein [Photobacterium galatheae]